MRRFDPPPTRYAAGHRGVDLATAPGVPVRAAGAGRVSYAGVLAGRGVVVVVHGALRTTYEPVTAALPVGAVVARGEVVGLLDAGHAGCRAPACLHWGLRRGEEYLDPLGLLTTGPVRLLPLGAAAPSAVPAEPVRPEPVRAQPPAAPGPVRPAGSRPGPGEPVASGPRHDTAGWGDLRALASPEGGLAALGLLAGLHLLRRPGRPPAGPAGAAAAAAGSGPQAPAPSSAPEVVGPAADPRGHDAARAPDARSQDGGTGQWRGDVVDLAERRLRTRSG